MKQVFRPSFSPTLSFHTIRGMVARYDPPPHLEVDGTSKNTSPIVPRRGNGVKSGTKRVDDQ